MRESGGMTIMALMLMRLSASVAQEIVTGPCERVLVEIAEASGHEEHSGKFYLVGEGLEFKPLYRSEGDYILQYVEDGDDYSTYEEPSTPDELYSSPNDNSLEDNQDLETNASRVDRRSLQACGYWAIGMRGQGDNAMYPMIKVADCADDPTEIDEDSVWFHQDCFDCAQTEVGDVVITLEEYACGSYTFPPTPAPTSPLDNTPETPDATPSPVDDAVSPTPSPVDADTTPSPVDADTTRSPVDADPNDGDVNPGGEESGASKVGGLMGAGAGVAAALLAVAASVFANTIQ